MNELLFREQVFEKEKDQVHYLYSEPGLGELGYFKVMVDGHLVEETDPIDDQYMDEEINILPSLKETIYFDKTVREVGIVQLEIPPKYVFSI